MRRPRPRAATAALAATLATAGLVLSATVPAQAAPTQPAARVALPAGSPISIENVVIMDHNTNNCLDGTLAVVYMQPCNAADKHQVWARIEYAGYDVYENQYNFYCLDATLSAVTVRECNDGQHQHWIRTLFTGGNLIRFYRVENQYVLRCLDNNSHVNTKDCGSDGAYELWIYAKVS